MASHKTAQRPKKILGTILMMKRTQKLALAREWWVSAGEEIEHVRLGGEGTNDAQNGMRWSNIWLLGFGRGQERHETKNNPKTTPNTNLLICEVRGVGTELRETP